MKVAVAVTVCITNSNWTDNSLSSLCCYFSECFFICYVALQMSET